MSAGAADRPAVTVLNAFAVHPPSNGGTFRIHHLYRALARFVDVELVTLGLREEGSDVVRVAPGFRELRVARSKKHEAADRKAQAHARVPVYDVTAYENACLTPDYRTMLDHVLSRSCLAVVTHPFMVRALREAGWDGPFVHESHNFERELKARMLPKSKASQRLVEMVGEAEGECCRGARMVYATAQADAEALLQAYGGRAEDMVLIPNGTDVAAIEYTEPEARRRLRERVGLGERPVALFLASGHRPNLEAAEKLFDLAPRLPDVNFALLGNAADAFEMRHLPPNVWLVGLVPDGARNVWLQAASVALNPMLYGGGTNLKLLDYFAAGIPVVTTEIGLRGGVARGGEHALVADIDDMHDAIRRAIAGGPEIERMTRAARALVEEHFDWRRLGERLHGELVKRNLLS